MTRSRSRGAPVCLAPLLVAFALVAGCEGATKPTDDTWTVPQELVGEWQVTRAGGDSLPIRYNHPYWDGFFRVMHEFRLGLHSDGTCETWAVEQTCTPVHPGTWDDATCLDPDTTASVGTFAARRDTLRLQLELPGGTTPYYMRWRADSLEECRTVSGLPGCWLQLVFKRRPG